VAWRVAWRVGAQVCSDGPCTRQGAKNVVRCESACTAGHAAAAARRERRCTAGADRVSVCVSVAVWVGLFGGGSSRWLKDLTPGCGCVGLWVWDVQVAQGPHACRLFGFQVRLHRQLRQRPQRGRRRQGYGRLVPRALCPLPCCLRLLPRPWQPAAPARCLGRQGRGRRKQRGRGERKAQAEREGREEGASREGGASRAGCKASRQAGIRSRGQGRW
jgi:hypothetical protein